MRAFLSATSSSKFTFGVPLVTHCDCDVDFYHWCGDQCPKTRGGLLKNRLTIDNFYKSGCHLNIIMPDGGSVMISEKGKPYGLIGGKFEFGETPADCLWREICEEVDPSFLRSASAVDGFDVYVHNGVASFVKTMYVRDVPSGAPGNVVSYHEWDLKRIAQYQVDYFTHEVAPWVAKFADPPVAYVTDNATISQLEDAFPIDYAASTYMSECLDFYYHNATADSFKMSYPQVDGPRRAEYTHRPSIIV